MRRACHPVHLAVVPVIRVVTHGTGMHTRAMVCRVTHVEPSGKVSEQRWVMIGEMNRVRASNKRVAFLLSVLEPTLSSSSSI